MRAATRALGRSLRSSGAARAAGPRTGASSSRGTSSPRSSAWRSRTPALTGSTSCPRSRSLLERRTSTVWSSSSTPSAARSDGSRGNRPSALLARELHGDDEPQVGGLAVLRPRDELPALDRVERLDLEPAGADVLPDAVRDHDRAGDGRVPLDERQDEDLRLDGGVLPLGVAG